jgi:hypothetical protein
VLLEDDEALSRAHKILLDDINVLEELIHDPTKADPVIWKGRETVVEAGVEIEDQVIWLRGLGAEEMGGSDYYDAPYWRAARLDNLGLLDLAGFSDTPSS